MTKLQEFKRDLETFGYIVPENAEFYIVKTNDKNQGKIGMKVGNYSHSCHIEQTDFVILFFIDGYKSFIKEYSDLWEIELMK
jgi:hypothetical protein